MADIKSVLNNIEKRFGKEIISKEAINLKRCSSGIMSLDCALGGGYPFGRIIELYGQESSGKSTLALTLAHEIQKLNKIVSYIDMEHAMDEEYAENLGVNTNPKSNKWIFSQPNNGEEALELVRELIKADDMGLIVIDSVAALIPKAELQGEIGESKMGLQARMMSQSLRMLTPEIHKSNCVVLFINQMREKMVTFGNPWTTTGGNALKFYASIRMEVSRIGSNKEGETEVSNKTRVKVTKNKVAPPFKKCEFDIIYGKGVDTLGDALNTAIELGIVTKKGAGWMNYGDIKLGQGDKVVKQILEDNPELLEEITAKILES